MSLNLNVIWAKGVVAAAAAVAERTAPFGFDGGDVDDDDDDEVSVVDGCFILGVLVIFTLLLVTLRLSYILIGLSSYAVVVVATSIVVFYYYCCCYYSEVV